MTPKNSSFKLRSLIRHCCGRQAALFTVSILGMLITLPVYMILGIQSRLRYFDTAALQSQEVRKEILENIQYLFAGNGMVNAALIILAIVAGIATFRYLHVRNQTDFFHALPITRTQMFISHVLTGILAVIPAYLIGVILSYGVCAAYGFADAFTLEMAAYSIFAHIAGFLFVYAVTILAAIISGNTLVSILVCGWFQLGLAAGWVAVRTLIHTLYPASQVSTITIPYYICPITGLFQTTSAPYSYTSINFFASIDEFQINYFGAL